MCALMFEGMHWHLEKHPKGILCGDNGDLGWRYPDIAFWLNGKIAQYFEVKAKSRYTYKQREKDAWIQAATGIPTTLWRVHVKKTKWVCVKNCPI